MKSLGSVTTSLTGREVPGTAPNSTGLQHGKPGSVAVLTSENLPANSVEVRAPPATVNPALSAAAKPQLPGFLVTAIDPDDARVWADLGWQAPKPEFCSRHKLAIKEALASLAVHCEPAPEPFVRTLLARCAQVKYSRDGTPAEWELRAAEYLRLLGHYPADIWQTAVDGHMLASRFFPDISELEERMAPELTRRRVGMERLEAMRRPAIAAPLPTTPEEREAMQVKLRRLSTLTASGELERLSEAEAKRFCETGEYPPEWGGHIPQTASGS